MQRLKTQEEVSKEEETVNNSIRYSALLIPSHDKEPCVPVGDLERQSFDHLGGANMDRLTQAIKSAK